MSSKIKSIKAKEILDSRGNPTVEVELEAGDKKFIASVPSGASTGKYEAVELRDDNKGVLKAVDNIINIIAPKLTGMDPTEQEEIDEIMIDLDATDNKSELGANAILPVSIAVLRAGAFYQDIPLYKYISQIFGTGKIKLPYPCFNLINGGAHAKNNLDIQEFMVVSQESSFSKNFQTGKDIYKALEEILGKEAKKGDEGGFAPLISGTDEALKLLNQAIANCPAVSGTKFGLDCAASQFFLPSHHSAESGTGSEGRNNKYHFEGKDLNGSELKIFYQNLLRNYPIIFIEDPFAEDDWESWKMSNIKSSVLVGKQEMSNVLIIGDDLTVTNKKRVKKAIELKCVNGIIIKPNQVGTITETLETVKLARENGLKLIVSHRSGETNDDFIADLAVGIGADFIKSGAPGPKERMAKYDRLLEIEKEISKYPYFRPR